MTVVLDTRFRAAPSAEAPAPEDHAVAKPKPGFSRRQALKVVAAAAAVPAAIVAFRNFAPQPTFHTWNGIVLGGDASLSLWHPDETYARQIIAKMLSEVGRLERSFSLFQPDSEISRLNADGRLASASGDFRAVLGASLRMAEESAGAFDPTVQALWDLNADYFRTHPDGAGPEAGAVAEALRHVRYDAIDLSAREVAFAVPGVAITLNAIAQGYITDRVTDLLRTEGFDHVVVELGEMRTLGLHPEGRLWRIGLKNPADPAQLSRTVEIAEAAVSVSGGYGTPFGGENHHIFDPRTGGSANTLLDATVIGPRATLADALSTAICVSGEAGCAALLAANPGYRAILTRPDGTTAEFPAA
ncbi:MAG: FAD:protein FMN transferase [Bauldia sp.]|nr:FAD:protein FMN transferase [Bauldia sp.]